MILNSEYFFHVNAVYNSNKNYYKHFGIHPKIVSLYGVQINDIVEVVLRVSENQSITDDLSIPDYWGWFCYTQNKFTIIQLNYPFLNLCFPYGIKAAELHNKGKAYRLEIVNAESNFK